MQHNIASKAYRRIPIIHALVTSTFLFLLRSYDLVDFYFAEMFREGNLVRCKIAWVLDQAESSTELVSFCRLARNRYPCQPLLQRDSFYSNYQREKLEILIQSTSPTSRAYVPYAASYLISGWWNVGKVCRSKNWNSQTIDQDSSILVGTIGSLTSGAKEHCKQGEEPLRWYAWQPCRCSWGAFCTEGSRRPFRHDMGARCR